MLNYCRVMAKFNRYKVASENRYVVLKIDEDELESLIKECVEAIKKAHPDFFYDRESVEVAVYTKWIYIKLQHPENRNSMTVDVIDLYANLYWLDIDKHICKLEAIELADCIFPYELSKVERLEFQKYIMKDIWNEWHAVKEIVGI